MSKVTPPCVENCPAGDLAAKFKICVVTAARSEYGLLRWLMQDIKDDPELCLQVLVTGSHLSPEFGLTVNEITEQGFAVDAAVDMLLSSASAAATAKGMGLAGIGAADALERLAPDILFVLGDRYELLPICGAALVMGIPIAHASGGDVTEGAIDDQIRHDRPSRRVKSSPLLFFANHFMSRNTSHYSTGAVPVRNPMLSINDDGGDRISFNNL